MTNAIANHVAHQYQLNKNGAQLVAVVAEPPEVTSGTHKVTISEIAVRETAQTDNGIQISTRRRLDRRVLRPRPELLDLHRARRPSTRGRLVRREALEVALYTFKFVPRSARSSRSCRRRPATTASTLLYLQKSDLTKQLSEPLDKTLPLANAAAADGPDTHEAATIDKLTLPAVYSYSLQQLQDGSAALVLNPFSSLSPAGSGGVALDEGEHALQASPEASANSSCLRSKKLCGAPA